MDTILALLILWVYCVSAIGAQRLGDIQIQNHYASPGFWCAPPPPSYVPEEGDRLMRGETNQKGRGGGYYSGKLKGKKFVFTFSLNHVPERCGSINISPILDLAANPATCRGSQ